MVAHSNARYVRKLSSSTMDWTGEHRAFAVEKFLSCNSIKTTQRAFRMNFKRRPTDPIPARNTILLWVSNFRATGSAKKRKSTGRPRTVRNETNVASVSEAVERSPQRSARKHSLSLGLSSRSVRRILHRDLRMYPYKTMIAQELTAADLETRKHFCLMFEQSVPPDDTVIFSDEAHFHLNGSVNKQNSRYWAKENPRELHERPLHCPRVTVWCGISIIGILGPYFFEEDNATVTVNSDRYCSMLENFLEPQLSEFGYGNVWFQQDGATAHTSRRSMEVLREMFPGRLISLRGDIGWPARSPDLNPCDFFLWGYLKSKVYINRPQTIAQLKDYILQEAAAIPTEISRRVIENFRKRLRKCIQSNGSHLTDFIFKTQ